MSQERKRIANLSVEEHANESVVLKNLTKVYPSTGMVAVDHLSLGIPRKECFGLLGVNGMQKSNQIPFLNSNDLNRLY